MPTFKQLIQQPENGVYPSDIQSTESETEYKSQNNKTEKQENKIIRIPDIESNISTTLDTYKAQIAASFDNSASYWLYQGLTLINGLISPVGVGSGNEALQLLNGDFKKLAANALVPGDPANPNGYIPMNAKQLEQIWKKVGNVPITPPKNSGKDYPVWSGESIYDDTFNTEVDKYQKNEDVYTGSKNSEVTVIAYDKSQVETDTVWSFDDWKMGYATDLGLPFQGRKTIKDFFFRDEFNWDIQFEPFSKGVPVNPFGTWMPAVSYNLTMESLSVQSFNLSTGWSIDIPGNMNFSPKLSLSLLEREDLALGKWKREYLDFMIDSSQRARPYKDCLYKITIYWLSGIGEDIEVKSGDAVQYELPSQVKSLTLLGFPNINLNYNGSESPSALMTSLEFNIVGDLRDVS